jgi:hypothetical protein
MECELDNCFDKAVARIPVLGVLRHVCAFHAGGGSEPEAATSLDDAIGLVRMLEYYETRQHFDGYDVTLADFRRLWNEQPVTAARALWAVLQHEPRSHGESSGEAPF